MEEENLQRERVSSDSLEAINNEQREGQEESITRSRFSVQRINPFSLVKNFAKFGFILLFLFFSGSIINQMYFTDNSTFSQISVRIVDSSFDYLDQYLDYTFSDVDYIVRDQRASTSFEERILIDDEDNYYDIEDYLAAPNERKLEESEIKDVNDPFLMVESNSTTNQTNPMVHEPNTTPRDLVKQNYTHNETNLNNHDFKYNLLYEFVSNITSFSYKGKWSNLKVENNIFENTNGEVRLEIYKNFTAMIRNNFISNIEAIEALYFSVIMKDGYYKDNYVDMNFTLSFPANFSHTFYDWLQSGKSENKEKKGGLDESIQNPVPTFNKLSFSNKNVPVRHVIGEIFGENNKTTCNQTNIDIEFIQERKLYKSGHENQVCIEFPRIQIQMVDRSCSFSVDLALEIDESYDKEERIWNYSLTMTAISIIEIYLTLKLLYEVSDNDQVGKNICLITLGLNIMWNSFLCTIHFYLSITNEDFSYEYGTPSMTYFLLFSIFELRLLFFVWRSRYHHLVYTDLPLFRKKLLRFYSTFYILLFFGLLTIRYIFSNFWTCYLLFASTWIFQIIHSIVTGTKPPYSMKYVFMLSVGKLFAPLYIKACPYNIFEIKPSFWKMLLIFVTVLLEIGIIALQKLVGPKFLVPACLKKKPYNYYQELDSEEIKTRNINTECVICLDFLVKPPEESQNNPEQIERRQVEVHNRNLFSIFHKLTTKFKVWIESLKYTYHKKKFMITPCNHVFHTACMEKWMDLKNECPYCRRPIPPLE